MMILATGGSGSGKSAFAEDCVLSFKDSKRIYIATMIPYDDEGRMRVKRHRNMRAGKGFETVECFTDLKSVTVPEDCTVLLECMSNLAANEMFCENGAHKDTVSEVLAGIHVLKAHCRNLVVVTNEIFSDGASYDGDMADYLSALGEINAALAEMSDTVAEVVYGIPIYHKKGEFSL